MSEQENEEDNVSPSFEEQIKFLRRSRGAKGTLFQKTTEHNVVKKLQRELATKTRTSFEDQQKDLRLEETLNRETEKNIFSLYDSLSLSGISFQRHGTKSFSVPVSSSSALTQASEDSATPTPINGTNRSSTQERTTLLRTSARTTGVHKAYDEPEDRTGAQVQDTTHSSHAVDDSELILGRAVQDLEKEKQSAFLLGQTSDRDAARASLHEGSTDRDSGANSDPTLKSRSDAAPDSSSDRVSSSDTNMDLDEDSNSNLHPSSWEASRSEEEPAANIDSSSSGFNTEFLQKMSVFTGSTGLDLVMCSMTEMQIILSAGGSSATLHQVSLNDGGLEEARIFARSLTQHYLSSLSDDFNIEFGHPGEMALHQTVFSNGRTIPGKPLFVRTPRLDELKALHAALEFSWPASAQLEDQPAMRFVFVDDLLAQNDYTAVRLKFLDDGRPVIFITPALCLEGAPTNEDLPGSQSDSWQTIIMRELAWKTLADCQKLPLSSSDCRDLGWIECAQLAGAPAYGLYLLCTADGEYFYPNPEANSPDEAWIRVSEQGEYLNANGKSASSKGEIVYKTAAEIHPRARIRPAGQLFHSPEEELADAVTAYRSGRARKGELLRASPSLYRLSKTIDQAGINRWYKPTRTSAGLIREENGALVDNNPDNQSAILAFEQAERHR